MSLGGMGNNEWALAARESGRSRPSGMDVAVVFLVAGPEHLGGPERVAAFLELADVRVLGGHGDAVDLVDVEGDAGVVARAFTVGAAGDLGDAVLVVVRPREHRLERLDAERHLAA